MSVKVESFRDLEVWRKAHELAKEIYALADSFPKQHLFDLTPQLRRAALSIPTNLAEGSATSSSKELLQFINIAKRSISEVEYLLMFAAERQLLSEQTAKELDGRYEEIHRMLGGLRRSLNGRRAVRSNTHHSPLVTHH